jgi:hypothetical protein
MRTHQRPAWPSVVCARDTVDCAGQTGQLTNGVFVSCQQARVTTGGAAGRRPAQDLQAEPRAANRPVPTQQAAATGAVRSAGIPATGCLLRRERSVSGDRTQRPEGPRILGPSPLTLRQAWPCGAGPGQVGRESRPSLWAGRENGRSAAALSAGALLCARWYGPGGPGKSAHVNPPAARHPARPRRSVGGR